MRRANLHILSHLLPLLFSAYLCSISLFTHTHEVNGVVIVHSHPFKDGHAHTPQQLDTIWHLTHPMFPQLPAWSPLLNYVPVFLGIVLLPSFCYIVCCRVVRHFYLRAPPSAFRLSY